MNGGYNSWSDMCVVNVRRDAKVSQEVLRSFMSATAVLIGSYHINDDEHVAVV